MKKIRFGLKNYYLLDFLRVCFEYLNNEEKLWQNCKLVQIYKLCFDLFHLYPQNNLIHVKNEKIISFSLQSESKILHSTLFMNNFENNE